MHNRFGPIRLIALQCGKFDYAEIELDRPLHLVGPNNVGKTSLIALLQFLYLDEQRSMRFSREMQETRKYYFPTVYSYALFECLTKSGFQTVGVRGGGPVRQYEFERFTWQGRYDADMFFDAQNRVRPFDDIRARLVPKGYTSLSPATLRAALTGVGDSRKVMLGLVPAKNRDTYPSFRTLFCNILRLAHIRQEEMKELLLALFASGFHQPDGIDLAATYQENFEKVKRDTRAVQMLKELVPDIDRALRHREKRDAARQRLPGLYLGVTAAAQTQTNRLRHALATSLERRRHIAGELEQTDHQRDTTQEDLKACTRQLTRLNDWLATTADMATALADFLPDWNAQRLAEVERLADELAARLGNLNTEPPAIVAARLTRHESERTRLQARLDHADHTAIQTLRNHFQERELRKLFTLLNPELLGVPLNQPEPGVTVTDEKAVVATLRALLANGDENTFTGAGTQVALASLAAPVLDAFGDPQRIRADIAALDVQIGKDRRLCRDAEAAETLRREKQLLETERRELLRRQEQFEVLQGRRAELPACEQQAEEAQRQEQVLTAHLKELAVRSRQLTGENQTLQREEEDLNAQEQRIMQLLGGITRPPPGWESEGKPATPAEGDLEDLAARFRRDDLDQQRQDDAFRETLKSIEERTYSRYAGADEQETIQRLGEAREALPGLEQAANELWKSIAVGIRENLHNMGSDLDTLRARISTINRGLAGIGISNLKSLKLVVVDNPQWTKRISSIRVQDDMPLFAEAGAVDKAFEDIGRLLSERPRIELGDLFNLEFEITMPDDTVRKYPHLDRIESNGTTIAIKVLVNLSLLRDLLGSAEVAVPFYLDECSSLDSDNLRAIVDTAEKMGFNAVLASPEAMDATTRLYYIQEQENGRVILDPRRALVEFVDDEEEAPDA